MYIPIERSKIINHKNLTKNIMVQKLSNELFSMYKQQKGKIFSDYVDEDNVNVR